MNYIYCIILKEMIATSSDRMVKLASKWEEVREPLVRGLRDLKSKKELTEASIRGREREEGGERE